MRTAIDLLLLVAVIVLLTFATVSIGGCNVGQDQASGGVGGQAYAFKLKDVDTSGGDIIVTFQTSDGGTGVGLPPLAPAALPAVLQATTQPATTQPAE